MSKSELNFCYFLVLVVALSVHFWPPLTENDLKHEQLKIELQKLHLEELRHKPCKAEPVLYRAVYEY